VRFKAIELIRQDTTLDEFVVYGDLENIDDYNSRPVPYQLVRSGGQHGNCRATQYRVGAEYLFLLKHVDGTLTPYWQGLAPMNEQLRGPADPWLAWVKARVRKR
jgi:hypothetical protein